MKHVALMKCFICGDSADIILHKRLGDVSNLHGKTVEGMMCSDCRDKTENGVTFLIEVKPGQDKKNPYRTGRLWGIKASAAKRIFNTESPVAYIEEGVAEEIGLIK